MVGRVRADAEADRLPLREAGLPGITSGGSGFRVGVGSGVSAAVAAGSGTAVAAGVAVDRALVAGGSSSPPELLSATTAMIAIAAAIARKVSRCARHAGRI